MNSSKIKEYVYLNWDQFIIPLLQNYIKIPNKSPAFDAEWEANGYMRQAAELFFDSVDAYQLHNAKKKIVTLPNRTPVITVDVPATHGSGGNVLLYGHYDKQPEFIGWKEGLGPWMPVIENNRLFGRGGADDGYALFGALSAIAALENADIPHPRCLILIEGCEESGSFDLPFYLEELLDDIGKPDLLVCLDAECGNYDQLWLTTSLRGMLSGTLNVEVLREGIHSGAAGGIVPSSFRLLRQLMDRIEDSHTSQLADVLQGPIPDFVQTQSREFVETLGSDVISRFPWSGTTGPHTADLEDLVTRNSWGPSLATVGLGGAPDPSNAGNTLRPNTQAKLVFRLPPNVDAKRAAEEIKLLLEQDPPQGATVEFDIDAAETGWHAKPLDSWLVDSLRQASVEFFDSPTRQMGCGGTIPFMAMLGKRFPSCQFIVTGVLGPHSNAHGPNEFLDIETGKRVSCCIARVLADSVTHLGQPNSV